MKVALVLGEMLK